MSMLGVSSSQIVPVTVHTLISYSTLFLKSLIPRPQPKAMAIAL